MRQHRVVGTALCCALSGLGWGSPALAQQCATRGAQAQAKSDVAKDLYEQGWAAVQKKNWEAARAAFLEAWRCKQHWQIALSLGWAEVKTGKYREGAEHLRYFQRESQGDQAATAADRKTAQEMLDEARKHVGALTITMNEAGAELSLDDEAVGKAPLPEAIFVEPGQHIVVGRLQGYAPSRGTLTVGAGESVRVDLRLVKEAQRPPVPPPDDETKGHSAFKSRPWLIGGGVVVTVVAAGVGAWSTWKANSMGAIAYGKITPLTKRPGDKGPCGYGDKVNMAVCNDINSALVKQDKFETIAVAGYIIAGAASAGTLAIALWPKTETKKNHLQLAPVVGSTSGGVLLNGSF